MSFIDRILETDLLPDFLIRIGIRRLLRQTLGEKLTGDSEHRRAALLSHIEGLKKSPVAVQMQAANEQHYEVPTRFYQHCLGNRLKYSSGYWDSSVRNLNEAEERMLGLTCARAELSDGQHILELGCGWGSLSLWMAEHYPSAQDHGRLQLQNTEGTHRRRGHPPRVGQPYHPDRRHERV